MAAAALVCLTLLGGVSAWRWVMQEDTGVVVDAQARPSAAVDPRRLDGVADASGTAAHTEVEVAARTPGDSATVARPRVRRLLHAGATGRVPYSPSFDPHRNALVFHAGLDHTALLEASLRSDGTVDEVSTVREDGSSSYHAQVSPDGQWLAYDSDAEGQRAVYVARRDGSSPRRVSGVGYASVPSWSPDGAYVAFARAEPGRPRVWNVWTVHVASGRLERQTNHAVGQPWGASWFPDGRRIAYSHEDRLIVRDVDTGASRTYPTPVQGRLVRTPAVSPDGERIVFQVRRDGAWVLDLRTGEPQRILADASAQEFAWSPDGQRVAYHSVRGGQWGIWMLDLAVDAGP
jgi:Tol biopolymer transport system component